MVSRYPIQIDSLPTVVDNFTPIRAAVINNIRDAVIAIEAELGIKPSSTFGTVKARLDALELLIIAAESFSANGDLAGTYTSQTVIGLQGYPISAFAPTDGYVLTYDSIDGYWHAVLPQSNTPGGSDTQIQFNDGGTLLGGNGGFTYDKTTNVLSVSDAIAIGTTAAATGNIRLPSTTSIIASRNAADSADFVALATDASDNLYVGAAADGTADYAQVIINPGSFGYLYLSGVPKLIWGANDMTISTINTIQNGNANGLVTDVIRSLHTTDATVTNIYTWTIRVDAVTTVDALITAIADDGTVGASYKRTVTFRESTGVNLIGTLHDNQTDEDAAAWTVTIDDDGAGVGRIRVTGDAVLGVTWYVSGRVQHVILTP